MNIITLLRDRAAVQPERLALIDRAMGGWRYTTYAQLEQASQRLAGYLHRQGLRVGDGVLIWQPMSLELYVAIAAVLRLGLVALFLAPDRDFARNLQIYPARALIASRRAHLWRWRDPALRGLICRVSIGGALPGAIAWQTVQQQPADAPLQACAPETPALIAFTSGSTGQPKATLRAHGLLLAQFRALQPVLQFRAAAVEATLLPLFVLPNLAAGLTVLLPPARRRAPGRAEARWALAALQQHRASRLLAAPAFLQHLTDWGLARGAVLPALRQIFLGGAPVLPALVAQLQQLAPAAEIAAVYGSTEAEPIASLRHDCITPADLARMRAGGGLPAGRPVADIHLQILEPRASYPTRPLSAAEFTACCQPPGEIGEIAVSGAHVLPGYLPATRNAGSKLRVGEVIWHRTGDAGYLDAQGRLWLLGRCRGCLHDRAGTLYPLAGEAIANNHPGVRRSALVSLAGERTLLLELAAPVQFADLQQAVAPLGVTRLVRCRRLPIDRRQQGKLDYAALERWLARRR